MFLRNIVFDFDFDHVALIKFSRTQFVLYNNVYIGYYILLYYTYYTRVYNFTTHSFVRRVTESITARYLPAAVVYTYLCCACRSVAADNKVHSGLRLGRGCCGVLDDSRATDRGPGGGRGRGASRGDPYIDTPGLNPRVWFKHNKYACVRIYIHIMYIIYYLKIITYYTRAYIALNYTNKPANRIYSGRQNGHAHRLIVFFFFFFYEVVYH